MNGIENSIRYFAKSAPFRKGKASALAVAKMVHRISSSGTDYAEWPPIVVNSLPKSGTHLLLQVILGLPRYASYGDFIATTPSLTMHRRSDAVLARKIARLAPGEVCGAHLYYSDRIAEALQQRGAVSLFIYRDPRDVFWSEMQYLLSMNRWHRSGRRARRFREFDQQFDFFLHGKQRRSLVSFEWPNFANRVEPYLGWIEETNTFSCRYEALTDAAQARKSLYALSSHLQARIPSVGRCDQAEIVNKFLDAIRPEASHTFRSGKTQEWRTELTPSQIDSLEKEVAVLLPRFID